MSETCQLHLNDNKSGIFCALAIFNIFTILKFTFYRHPAQTYHTPTPHPHTHDSPSPHTHTPTQLSLTFSFFFRQQGSARKQIKAKIDYVSIFSKVQYLKAYSLISYRGSSQKISKLQFFEYICCFPLRSTFPPKEFSRNHFLMKLEPYLAKILVSENLFSTVVYAGAWPMHKIMHNL